MTCDTDSLMDLAGPGAAWAVLAALLLVSSVGVVSILKMTLILILTLTGCVLTFFLTLFVTTKVNTTFLCSRVAMRPPVIQRRPGPVSRSSSQSPVMTGCEDLDRPVQDIINFIIRDYVMSWYGGITCNNSFPGENIEHILHSCRCNIAIISR